MTETTNCPICGIKQIFQERYPNYVCEDCSPKISDKNGVPVQINFAWSGGHYVVYTEKDARYFDEFIYIDGTKCKWEDDRFGRGIMIQKVEN